MKKLTAPLVMAVLLATGCANQVKQDVTSTETIHRELLSETVSMTPLQGTISPQNSLEASAVALRYDTITQEKVTRKTVTNVVDVATPYSAARELYEFPAGILSIAGGIVINAVDFALLGMLPNSITEAPLAVGFAGINPFLNIESKNRVVSTPVSTDAVTLDEKVEVTTIPLAGKPITFASGESSLTAMTGNDGVVNAFLGGVVSPESTELLISVENLEDQALKVYVPRWIRKQAEEAQTILSKYQPGSGEAINAHELESDLEKLESMGYHEYVQLIEQHP